MKSVNKKGFTLVEVLVGSAVFLIIALAAYNAYVGLFKLINLSQYKVLAISLANEQFEIARNMPYSDVGIENSIPSGEIPHIQTLVRGGISFVVDTTIRNIDLPFDGTIGGSPNDISPADNKLVEISVSCSGCNGMKPITLTGQVAPKNLETASTNGALFIQVFDANGQPVKDADVHVVNVATTTTIVIDDVTDINGRLQLVDIPPGTDAYRITVSKPGFSSDRTYPVGGVGNPLPTKTDATVLLQQVTQISFAIDYLGNLSVSSVSPTCAVIPNVDFSIVGSKQIGQDVSKYSRTTLTNGSGVIDLGDMEWDTYTVTPTDGTYDLAGLNPLNPVIVNPGASQHLQLIMIPKYPISILVTVKDSSLQLPISDAVVTLTKIGFSEEKITGKGYINQTDWVGGDSQASFSDATKYWADDTHVDVATNSGEVRLKDVFGTYDPNGVLESSTFDTGSASNFDSFSWSPSDAPLLAGSGSVLFQLASVATVTPTTTWAYLGPDDTSGSYYSISNSPISSGHSSNQFLRYKMYLATQTATVTPNISDVAFTYTSSCTPPGQVIFSGLSSGTYHVNVTKAGYTAFDQDVTVDGGWQEVPVVLSP